MNSELEKAEEAVNRYRRDGDTVDLAKALRCLGHLERRLKLNAAAVRHFEEAVSIYRANLDNSALAHTIRHLGDIHLEASRFDSAEACYQESLGLYRGQKEVLRLDLANAIRSMALLKGDIGARDEAKLLWQEARNLYSSLRLKEGVAECDDWLSK